MNATATYHGIIKIRCDICGYETTDVAEMEMWNDYGVSCILSADRDTCSGQAGRTTFWMADGTVNTVDSDDA
jgi:hypothetical protein